MIAIAGVLGILIRTLGSGGNVPVAFHKYCSNVSLTDPATNSPLSASINDICAAENKDARIDVNYYQLSAARVTFETAPKQTCVNWFEDDYPFDSPYAQDPGTRSRDS
jgi:hypothetical protein